MAKLKVYRTPIGFHDAYVAASSQKATLAAWGTDRNLFARGVAEIVTDAALTKEPFEQPGVVIRRSRGTAAEQLAALAVDERVARAGPSKAGAQPGPRRTRPAPPKPRPDRHKLDLAEQAVDQLRAAHARELRDITNRIATLEKERVALVRAHDLALTTLESTRKRAAAAFETALQRWRD